MPYINQYYLFVEDGGEKVTRSVTISDHPVETGMVITDNVKRDPIKINLSGKIAGVDAETVKSALESLQKAGSYVKYVGKEILSNAVITDFTTTRGAAVEGSIDFDMVVREIRVAVSAYQNAQTGKTVKSGTQQVTEINKSQIFHTTRDGDTLYSLSLMYYGSDAGYTKIYTTNEEAIEAAAVAQGYPSSEGGSILMKGLQLLIPRLRDAV